MNKNELIPSRELSPSQSAETEAPSGMLTKDDAERVYAGRQHDLEQVRPFICLKFYHEISEKLEREKRQFDRLLHIEDKKQDILSRYTFVLNPYFFEQRFIDQRA